MLAPATPFSMNSSRAARRIAWSTTGFRGRPVWPPELPNFVEVTILSKDTIHDRILKASYAVIGHPHRRSRDRHWLAVVVTAARRRAAGMARLCRSRLR